MPFSLFSKKPKKDLNRGLNHIKALVKLANYNNAIREEEKTLIYRIGRKFKFSRSQINLMIKDINGMTYVAQSKFKTSKQAKNLIVLLSNLEFPSKEQQDYCYTTCHELGYSSEMIRDLQTSMGLKQPTPSGIVKPHALRVA